ncbi:MAG: hypothetical protein ACRDLL_03315 [Solirubrobacterales bacterium]
MTVARDAIGSVTLPLDPRQLVAVAEPLDRGLLYNEIDLDHSQRRAAEDARRMCLAGTYPEAVR